MSTDEKREPEADDARKDENEVEEDDDEDEGEWEEFEAPVPPDGGWGWIVLISSFLSNVIVDGVCYTYSIFFNELLDYFGASRGKTALVGALLPACYLLVGTPYVSVSFQLKQSCLGPSSIRSDLLYNKLYNKSATN